MNIPGWAVQVLIEPATNSALQIDEGGYSPQTQQLLWKDSLLYLCSDDQLSQHMKREIFEKNLDEEVELLYVAQVRFRRILQNFLAGLPENSIVVDIGSSDAELAFYFAKHRYLPMDLSESALRKAVSLERIQFGIVADITQLPLSKESIGALISSHTLVHLTDEQLPPTLERIASSVEKKGQVLLTLRGAKFPFVRDVFSNKEWEDLVLLQHDSILDGFWVASARRVLNRLIRSSPKTLANMLARIYHAILSLISINGIRKQTSSSIKPEVSLVVIAKKK